jgi:hypothetical protein
VYTRPAISLDYVTYPVSTRQSGVLVDPTADVVEMAFVTEGTPSASILSGDWNTGSWETDASLFTPVYYVRCLVGPGGTIQLAAQVWDVYVRIHDTPETTVLNAGQIRLT